MTTHRAASPQLYAFYAFWNSDEMNECLILTRYFCIMIIIMAFPSTSRSTKLSLRFPSSDSNHIHFFSASPSLSPLYCIVLYCGRVPTANAPRMHCSRRLIVQTLFFSPPYLHRQVSLPETLVVKGGTTWARNGRWILPEDARLPRNIQGSFTCRKSMTWDKRLFTSLPKEGVLRIFSPWKNPPASVGFEPANLGTKGQRATSRQPKPLGAHGVPKHVGGDFVHLLRIYSSTCKVGFMSRLLHITQHTQY